MIRIFSFLLSIFFSLSSVYAVLNKDEFFMTHITPHFPQNGVMTPGVTRTQDGSLPDNNSIPNPRLTLHWTPFGVHESHDKNANTGVKYLIIERGAKPLSRVYGGEAEDLYMVGPHYLSKDSVVIVPGDEIDQLKKNNPYFRGQLESFDPKKEKIELAGKRIINSRNFNPTNISYNVAKVISEVLTLQNSKLFQVMEILKQDPSQGTLYKVDNRTFRLERAPSPEEQEFLVNGITTNAKEFFTYPGGFEWHEHADTIFSHFEINVPSLFGPIFKKANFLKEDLNKETYKDKNTVRNTNRVFEKTYNKIKAALSFKGDYTDDKLFIEEYKEVWMHNMSQWLELPSFQTNSHSPYFNKAFGETPYGSEIILDKEMKALQVKMRDFDPLKILQKHFSLNNENNKIEEGNKKEEENKQ